ncbi:alpha/beta fold hydrolase [Arthrobacter sp. NPDC092385]|uniref:alpha/beta fold hydrolase n=1 Tax=Arthrobacter sp. NPDC092385 TaxID=3363943 RepID=UPI00381D60A9
MKKWHIGWTVVGSLTAGLLAALLLVATPFIRAQESEVTGAVLCGFAVGWAMLAFLSIRFTNQPQRWAFAPAAFFGISGLLLVVFGSSVDGVLSWIWPPSLLALVIWMFIHARRRLDSRSRGWLLYPVMAVLALLSIGGGYQTVALAADASAHPMPGELIDVGGHSLHLYCAGSGSPTVVLQPGAGEMSSNHGWIRPAVARDTRVCIYDRAGKGWSDPADATQDASQITTELHTLLHDGNVPGPYVLAGHSFGGLYVLTFAARYPDEVVGMVLIDSTAPQSPPAGDPEAPAASSVGDYSVMGRISTLMSTSGRVGLSRLYSPFEDLDSLPPTSRDEVRANIATSNNLRSTLDEYVQGNASMQEAAALTDFGTKPLIVLTAGTGSDSKHLASEEKLAALSTNNLHLTVKTATHESLIADKNDASVTTQAILDVVTSVRDGEPLVN